MELLIANVAYVSYRLLITAHIVRFMMKFMPYSIAVLVAAQVSFIYDSGQGQLRVRSNYFHLLNGSNSASLLEAKQGLGVHLYHNGNEKLVTTATGVEVTGSTTSETLISTIATGTAPLTVASTTMVSNLNADKLDDKEFTDIIAEATALAIALG